MANTGYELSLTLQVSMVIAGVTQAGYPVTYQGRNEFAFNGRSYPSITALQLQQMKHTDFVTRLADFKAYVESIELGLTIDESGAYRENTGSCPTI